MGSQLSLPFVFLLPFLLPLPSPLFPFLFPATAKGSGDCLSSTRGSGRSRATKRHLVHFWAEKVLWWQQFQHSSRNNSSWCTSTTIIASMHKPKRSDGENCKTKFSISRLICINKHGFTWHYNNWLITWLFGKSFHPQTFSLPTGLIPRTLGPLEIILLNGWICLRCLLD